MDGSCIYGIRGDGAIGAVCIGIPVVGIVIFRNAIGIRGFIAVDMLHFPIGTGTEVIMGVVDAGSVGDIVAAGIYGVMMDDVGMAEIVHIGMAEIHCIHGMPASIYAIEGMAPASTVSTPVSKLSKALMKGRKRRRIRSGATPIMGRACCRV